MVPESVRNPGQRRLNSETSGSLDRLQAECPAKTGTTSQTTQFGKQKSATWSFSGVLCNGRLDTPYVMAKEMPS
jgi:hypothetical protein